jgi:hypothetical protein
MIMKRSQVAISAFVILTALAVAAQSGGQKSFELMKTLTGDWEGKGSEGGPVRVTYRMTAGGSALMAEIQSNMKGHSEDMISMIHMDGDRLLLTHYCAAGNQPRMQASASPDGKTVTFKFLDATNLANLDQGHMDHVVFNFIDANHHTEEWHFLVGGKEMVERFNLEKKG